MCLRGQFPRDSVFSVKVMQCSAYRIYVYIQLQCYIPRIQYAEIVLPIEAADSLCVYHASGVSSRLYEHIRSFQASPAVCII